MTDKKPSETKKFWLIKNGFGTVVDHIETEANNCNPLATYAASKDVPTKKLVDAGYVCLPTHLNQ